MAERPNILILMPDQQRADCLSYLGHPQLRTPNMDRIARQGVVFTQASTVSPLCMPARASFVSSIYPHNHGMWSNAGCLPPHDDTFFQRLQRSGYFTAHIGKSHYYSHGGLHMSDFEGYMRARGFEYVHETTGPWASVSTRSYMTDLWEEHGLYEAFKEDYRNRAAARKSHNRFLVRPSPLPEELYLDSYVGSQAEKFLRAYDDDRPLCLFVGFPGPHEPWDAPGRYAAMYDPRRSPDPIPYPESNSNLPESIREMPDFQPFPDSTPENIAAIRANYYGKISLIDHWIGRILDACEERGLLENMLVIFWSDHGEMLGDHRRLYKSTFFESSMRVPLIVSWPGRLPEGKRCDAPAETVDIYPTVLEAAGVEPSGRCLGSSLISAAEGSSSLREVQLSEVIYGGERRICIRTSRYKYAIRQDGKGYMLYDLRRDPNEQENLIGTEEELERDLREMLLTRLVSSSYSMRSFKTGPDGLPRPEY